MVTAPAWLYLDEDAFEKEFRPTTYVPRGYLHQVFARGLREELTRWPDWDAIHRKPLILDLARPLPARLRVYLYRATQHPSERQQGTFKIQLTNGVTDESGRMHLDRSDGVRPILCGYHPELNVFILWDAELHDLGEGFTFSKSVQAPPDLVWKAAVQGVATGTKALKKPSAIETIVAARPRRLAEALALRIRESNRTLIERVI